MASVLLQSVGAAAGNAVLPGLGGAFFGALGRGVGGTLDGKIGLGTHVTGPRLANLAVQDSRYGAGIPVIYGNARVAGNVIWSTDLIQTTHNGNLSGGKGGAIGGSVSTTTYTYSVHCAVGIAAGPIGGIGTIWADSTIIYQNGVWAAGMVDSASLYTGTTTQSPDPFMQSILGAGNVPAYRGLAYVVFDNLQLANFGNRLPNLTFEIIPATVTANPSWLGEVNAAINQTNARTSQNGGLRPITLSGNGRDVYGVLVGGTVTPGASCQFQVAHYDVTGNAPSEFARTSSASFSTAATLLDSSWALAPDNRYVALFCQSSLAANIFVLYDTVARQFGNVLSVSLSSSFAKQIAWIDAQHFVVEDAVGGVRGARVFARAGLNIIDLGFFGIWGAGSDTTRLPIYDAQFLPFAGGLLNLTVDAGTGSSYFTALYARALSWQNNALVVGPAVTILTGISTGTGAGPHANLVRTGDGEWTLCFGTVLNLQLLSFVPAATSATVTRPWQTVGFAFGTGTTQFPIFYGDRLVVAQRGASDNDYRLSDILLNTGSFSLAVNGASLTGGVALTTAFCAVALDSGRILLAGSGGANSNLGQLGILQRYPTGNAISTILSDILARAGYAPADYDVSALATTNLRGYVINDPTSARAAIEPLQVFAPFDLIETSGVLKAVLRHTVADMSIPDPDLRAAHDGQPQPPARQITRAQDSDLPMEITVNALDPARGFEINSQRARRATGASPNASRHTQNLNLPVICDATTLKGIAETRLYTLWAERELTRMAVSRAWMTLDAGDVVALDNGDRLRIAAIQHSGGVLRIDGFPVSASTATSNAEADTGQIITNPPLSPVATALYLMDLPLLQSTDDQAGAYVAATGLTGWTSANVVRSADGIGYTTVATLSSPATAGIATTLLGNGPVDYMDAAHTVNVQVMGGELASCSFADLLNGANAALLGSEIIQFQTATLIGAGLYTLGNLLRGRRGTEQATTTHATGERFVLLQTGAVSFVPALLTDRGATYQFRALTKGQTLGDAQDVGFTYNLASLQPFAPAGIAATRASGTGSDMTLTWKRRARINGDWVNYVDVPLDEPVEMYDVDIMNGAAVVRSFVALTTPTLTYTAAQQTADWGGSIPANFTVNVYQISARYGRGKAGVAVV